MDRLRLTTLSATVVLVALAAAACSSGGGITVSEAWARPSMGMDRAGAAYMVIKNDGDTADTLLGATSPAAATVEIHETTMGDDGTMSMSPVGSLSIPAGGTVSLEPGGYHVMLIDLTGDLVVGDSIEITLDFENAADVTVSAAVREG
jgi:copper(I)-binding protein